VAPLEEQGMTVDIFLSGYGCTGLPHVSPATARKKEAELVRMYGGAKRVKAHSFFARGDGIKIKSPTQDTGVHQAMLLLLSKKPLDYEAVLLWRYDLVPLTPMGPATVTWTTGTVY
jgi:hypothetical protein